MVRISVGSPTHHTSGRLYGVFFEDINHGADGGLNANMVNNYSFDGVYLDHHTWRMAGAERWRTQADSLRFWDFINCSAASLGSEIRGIHGQRVTTDCPAPPIHAHSRYARITSDVPSETGPAYLENLGYNGGGDNGGEPAFSIVADHTGPNSSSIGLRRARVLHRRRPHLFRQSRGTSGSWAGRAVRRRGR